MCQIRITDIKTAPNHVNEISTSAYVASQFETGITDVASEPPQPSWRATFITLEPASNWPNDDFRVWFHTGPRRDALRTNEELLDHGGNRPYRTSQVIRKDGLVGPIIADEIEEHDAETEAM